MKVCYLGNTESVHVQAFVKYFSEDGNEIHIFGRYSPHYNENVIFHNLVIRKRHKIAFKDDKDSSLHTSRRYFFNKTISEAIKFYDFARIRNIVKKIDPDIIHGHEAVGWGAQTALTGKYPKIITCWGSDVFRYAWESRLNYIKAKYTLKNVDLVHVTSKHTRDYIVHKFRVNKNGIEVIHWGVDLGLFSLANIKRNELDYYKEKFSIKDEDIVILYPKGFRDYEKQNYLTLLKAFSKLAIKNKNLKLILMSYGSTSGYKKVLKIIRESKLHEKVILITDFLSQEKMPIIYSLSDIIVVIPDTDQLSSAILEGMLSGNIPILSDIDAYKYYFKEGKNCFYVNPKDPESMVKVMEYCIDNMDKIKQKFRCTNTRLVKENFDRKKQMQKIKKMYEKLISK